MNLDVVAVTFAAEEEIERVESHIPDSDRITELDKERGIDQLSFRHFEPFLGIYISGAGLPVRIGADILEAQDGRVFHVVRRIERHKPGIAGIIHFDGLDPVDLTAFHTFHRKAKVIGQRPADRFHTNADMHAPNLVLVVHMELHLIINDEIVEIEITVRRPQILEKKRSPTACRHINHIADRGVLVPVLDARIILPVRSERIRYGRTSHRNGLLRRQAVFGFITYVKRLGRDRQIQLHGIGTVAYHERSERLSTALRSHIHTRKVRCGELAGHRSRRFPIERCGNGHIHDPLDIFGNAIRIRRNLFHTSAQQQGEHSRKEG